ncbi:hypothetical protein ACJRO7_034596 [Eucalyptus globulus]|uniref:Uncharacterized protein n=1 Tax=Eucalyptus globulus TaxID=34317 RepID=A0ABD3J488_EUCGL
MATSKQSKVKHIIGAPIRVLNKVRNLYMNSLMDCSTRVDYSGPAVGGPAARVPTLLPKSFYVCYSVNDLTRKVRVCLDRFRGSIQGVKSRNRELRARFGGRTLCNLIMQWE